MDKITKIIILLVLSYILLKSINIDIIEPFALSASVITDITQLDPTKFYYKGIRTTSATTTPSQNGGTTCDEFPEIVYQLAPVVNATCKTENQDSYYTFDTTGVKGNIIYPRFFTQATITGVTNVVSFSFNGTNAVLCASDATGNTTSVRYSTVFNSLTSSFNLRDGIVKQCSLNSDGFLGGANSAAAMFGSYPFYNNGWASISGGAMQLEVGKLPNSQPLNALLICVNSLKKVYTAQYGVAGFVESTSQPMTCVSADEDVLGGCDKDTGKAYYSKVTGPGVVNWSYITGSSAISYISIARNLRAIAINSSGKLIACKDVSKALSMNDWKQIVTIDTTLTFKSVCYRGGNVVSAVTNDNRLFIEFDISFIFSI